jgi:alpha-galactosidase
VWVDYFLSEMNSRMIAGIGLGLIVMAGAAAFGDETTGGSFGAWAATPPMGWNSYDAFGDSVTEAEVLANARYMRDHLAGHGWKYVVVDFRWYDPQPTGNDALLNPMRLNAALSMDEFGRLVPAPNRFPSSVGGKGFGPLADQIHGMGLKLGIHVMRGIPRMAVKANTQIEGTDFRAWEASSFDRCPWCPDMFGVDVSHPAGQAWYDSIFRLYAQWGVDFVKVDDLSQPYHGDEIAAIRRAIDACGRQIVFSTSPGPTPVGDGRDISHKANMWRISGDFWDHWEKLDHQFELISRWRGYGGDGHWPDADMIPFGHLGIRSAIGGPDRQTRLTKDEQRTLITLWCLAPSPLMFGGNLPDDDAWTDSLLTNDEVIAVDQDSAGKQAVRVMRDKGKEVWVKELAGGDLAVGVFNRGETEDTVNVRAQDLKVSGNASVRNLWEQKDLGNLGEQMAITVPGHGAVMLRVTAAK